MITPEQILELVNSEFGDKAKVFTPLVLRPSNLVGDDFESSKGPGVYVFLNEGKCLKVGKSQSNASKRALQHCGTDDTSSADGKLHMSRLGYNDQTQLLVFALNQPDCLHWVVALENYLERKLQPLIPSKRNG
jgi:hypothetical protein